MSKKVRGKTHRALRKPPASGRKPSLKLTGRDIEAVADELVTYHRLFHAMFQRREQRQWSLFYLCGQLSNLKRKTIEPMILELHGAIPEAVRALQRFISQGKWEVHSLVVQLQALVAEWLGDPDGVVIADGSGFPKQGAHSAAVARQYCGQLGKIANCQEGVFLVYASRHGYTFLDERLYVPGEWFGDEYQDRWKACGLPGTLRFQTEPDLALEMVQGLAHRAIVPFAWVTCDESFGKIPAFLDEIAALNKWYLAEVPANTRVWLRTPPVEPPGRGPLGRPRTRPRVTRTAPRPQEMRELAARLPGSGWSRRTIKEGSKGPMVAEFAFVRVTAVRDDLPGPRGWAVFRRSLGPGPEVKFYLSNAPTTCPVSELVCVSGLRWPVETALEEGKGEVGMDHYEIRTWRGWHHHIAQTFLAHLFLMRVRLLLKKKPRTHNRPGPPTRGPGHRRRHPIPARHARHCPLSSASEPCRLPLSPQTHVYPAWPPLLKLA